MKTPRETSGETSRGKSSGFTLIEVMVGLVLVGLILALMGGALRSGILNSEMIEARSERRGDVRLIQAFLRRQLQSARPVIWPGQGATRLKLFAAFEGDKNAVNFLANLPPAAGLAGLHQIRIQRVGQALILIRRITSGELQRFDFASAPRRTVLFDGVKNVRLGYFGKSGRETEARWHDAWKGRANLPDLVKINLDFIDPRPGAWPELVVAPMIAPRIATGVRR